VAVSGNHQSRVVDIGGGATVTIAGLTLINGNLGTGTQAGAGIYNGGTLTLTNATVSGNTTGFDCQGGGIYNRGTLTLNNATVSGNTTGFYCQGGGIYNRGTLTLNNATVSGNNSPGSYGGGIYNNGTLVLTNAAVMDNSVAGGAGNGGGGIYNAGGLTLNNSTVSGNGTEFNGGGILNFGTLTLNNSTVSRNNTGGGIDNFSGTLTLTNSTVSGNSGGGIDNSFSGTLMNNSTVSGNSGGGIDNFIGTLTLTNSTVSGNTAGGRQSAGGINNDTYGNYNATVLLLNSTIADNTVSSSDRTATQIYSGRLSTGTGQATIQLRNTIMSGDGPRPNLFADSGGTFVSQGYNLSSDDGGGFLTGTGDLTNTDPLLGPLQANGGPTQTMALLPGSPALNAGDPNQLGSTDQRGVVRSGGVNIGAYQASATAFVLGAPGPVQAGAPFDVTVTAVDPYNQVAVGYTGTVTFATSDPDPGVVLPLSYTFTLADGGVHTFPGATTLITPGGQMLTVTDTADGTITGSAIITVGSTAPGTGSGRTGWIDRHEHQRVYE
jgi:hypothetical protein